MDTKLTKIQSNLNNREKIIAENIVELRNNSNTEN